MYINDFMYVQLQFNWCHLDFGGLQISCDVSYTPSVRNDHTRDKVITSTRLSSANSILGICKIFRTTLEYSGTT